MRFDKGIASMVVVVAVVVVGGRSFPLGVVARRASSQK